MGQPFHLLAQPDPSHLARRRTLLPWSYALIQAFCGQTVSSMETVVTRPDGSPRFLLCSSTPLSSQQQQVSGAILVFQDLSAQVSLDQQKNSFLGMLSHELRTPVTAIQGFADLLRMQAAEGQSLADPLAQRAFATIVAQSEALTHLIGQLLDLSRLEQAQITLSWGYHDLVALLTSVVEALSLTAPRHHLHLVLHGRQAGERLPGWFDRERMQQVFYHLIANAIKYSPAGGTIEIGVRWQPERPQEVLLWVRDQGIGIAQHELAAIFACFYRSPSLDPALSGLGIGLYLVKDLVDRHGGRVWAESTPGHGSTFWLLLPLAPPEGSGFWSNQQEA